MLKAMELKDPNSCLNRAEDDEPIFVIRANDELAPSIVRNWCAHYMVSKGDAITAQQQIKLQEAMDISYAMKLWKERKILSTGG
jgi:hypothetical protein